MKLLSIVKLFFLFSLTTVAHAMDSPKQSLKNRKVEISLQEKGWKDFLQIKIFKKDKLKRKYDIGLEYSIIDFHALNPDNTCLALFITCWKDWEEEQGIKSLVTIIHINDKKFKIYNGETFDLSAVGNLKHPIYWSKGNLHLITRDAFEKEAHYTTRIFDKKAKLINQMPFASCQKIIN